MKTLLVLIAIGAIACANPFGEIQNNNEAEVAKTRVEVGAKCEGSKCSGNINVKGDWFESKDGTLVPIFEPVPAGGKVEVGAECNGSKCGGSVKVGVEWFQSEDGRIVAVPSNENHYESELSCNAGHCIRKYQVSKDLSSLLSAGSGQGESKEVIVDWFKGKDGKSLVGVPRAELAKTKVDVEIKCNGRHCSGGINVGGDWFVAGDGTNQPIPSSVVAQPAGSVEIGGQYNGQEYSGNLGVKITWFEDTNGNLIPKVVPQPAGGRVEVGAECHGSKCGGSIKVGVDWFVAANGVIILTPKPAGGHISGGIECHGSKCSGNVGVGVDWFKTENNQVVPVLIPIPRPKNDEGYGEVYRYRGHGGKIPIIPIKPKGPKIIKPKSYGADVEDNLDSYRGNVPIIPVMPNVPRLVDPKSYGAYNSDELVSYAKKIILERGPLDPKRPVEIIVDSDCKGLQIKQLKCNKVTVDLRFYRLPNGEIIPQVIGEEDIPENVSISQISPTTARFHVSVGGRVNCKGLKCKGHVTIKAGNRKRRDIAEGYIEEIYRATLTLYRKEGNNEPFDLIFEFPQSF
ncbi:hypothetical protein M0804_011071 [Polistes exclamans]|nr:hypothetical protein M0804_011071 [Polistes exclamans]